MAANIERAISKEFRTSDVLTHVAKLLQEIRFGSVELIIHEGRVVQVEHKEKLRFDSK